MLSPSTYRLIYNTVRALPDLPIVEIGGAAGAGSIALAWALQDSGKKSKVVAIEKCDGGSRSNYGGYDENLKIIQDNFRRFGVEERIVLYPHGLSFENGHEMADLIETDEIAAFFHDADGRLDRDFYLFWPRLRPGGLIIVDDYEEKTSNFQAISKLHPTGGAKHLTTFRLLNQMIDWGLFQIDSIKGNTVLGYKPASADFSRFDMRICQKIIRDVQRMRDRALSEKEAKALPSRKPVASFDMQI